MRSFGSVAPPVNMDDAFLSSRGQPSSVGCELAAVRLPVWRRTSQGSRRLMVSAAWQPDSRFSSTACLELVGSVMPSTSVGRSALISGVAEGQDLLRDASILIVDDCTLNRENLAATFVANGTAIPSVAWDLPSLIRHSKTPRQHRGAEHGDSRQRDVATGRQEISPNVRVIVVVCRRTTNRRSSRVPRRVWPAITLRTESLDDFLVSIRESCCRRVAVHASGLRNFAPSVVGTRFAAVTGGEGTSSYDARGPDPQDAGNGPVESGYRGAAVHCGSYGQKPRAQRVDQTWRQHACRSCGTLPHHPVHRGRPQELDRGLIGN